MTIEEEIRAQLAKQSGWCGPEKAIALCQLVRDTKAKLIVDVGVFAGKSTLSFAYGCRENQAGIVVGIDAWEASHCLFDVDQGTLDWWTQHVNLENVYQEFLGHVTNTGLAKWIRILRMTSYQAAKIVDDSVDVVHVDGCHSEWSSTSDVCMWLPKLKLGGTIIMDDHDWASTQTAVRFVLKCCEQTSEIKTNESHSAFYRKVKG